LSTPRLGVPATAARTSRTGYKGHIVAEPRQGCERVCADRRHRR
jgi:hypothetical protein